MFARDTAGFLLVHCFFFFVFFLISTSALLQEWCNGRRENERGSDRLLPEQLSMYYGKLTSMQKGAKQVHLHEHIGC